MNSPRSAFMPTTPWRTFQEEPKPSGSGTLGILGSLAVAVGVGVLGYYMLDGHSHTCEDCEQRWRHFGAFNLNDEDSHRCSRCGQVQWWKDGAPHVLRGSEFAAPPSLSATTAALRVATAPAVLTAPVPQLAFAAPPPAVPMRSLAAPPRAPAVALAIQSRRVPR